jgi:hypothetical protein
VEAAPDSSVFTGKRKRYSKKQRKELKEREDRKESVCFVRFSRYFSPGHAGFNLLPPSSRALY